MTFRHSTFRSAAPGGRSPSPRTRWSLSLAGGALAAVAAAAGMVALRAFLPVGSISGRVVEWLVFVDPLDVFGASSQRFELDAQKYAAFGAAGMLAALAGIGSVALRRRWSLGELAGLGLGLWLFAMAVVLPLTGAGFFALDLLDSTGATVAGYLAVSLTYGAVLALFRMVTTSTLGSGGRGRWSDLATGDRGHASRRGTLLLAGTAAGAYPATFAAQRWLSKSSLPGPVAADLQQPSASSSVDPANAHPTVVVALPPVAPHGTGLTSPAGGTLESPPARKLPRANDGALMPSGRRPGELAAAVTSVDDFYVVTKNAAGDPEVQLRNWRLRIDGDVQRPVEIDYASLRNLPAVEVTKTLECISNFVAKCELVPFGCDLISTARWRGARVRDLLALAGGPREDAVTLVTFAADEFTTSLPIEVALNSETLLAYEMNGQVLPRQHGYPARMLVPGRYGMKNAKWVVALRVLNRDFIDWYGQRNWSKTGIVKTMTRIDVPTNGGTLPPGEHRIAGIAYAGDRGVQKVEYSPDGGRTWRDAEFVEPPPSRDCWVRWQGRFSLAPGEAVTLISRATDGNGALQPEPFGLPQPDGGTGWHTCQIRASGAR